MHNARGSRIVAAIAVPWGGFVGVFLYYTFLAIMLLGGMSPDGAVVGLAYLAPVLAYAVFVVGRLGSRMA